ncbi:hypothetical protein [Arthrobacter psychrochitiniphilus]
MSDFSADRAVTLAAAPVQTGPLSAKRSPVDRYFAVWVWLRLLW